MLVGRRAGASAPAIGSADNGGSRNRLSIVPSSEIDARMCPQNQHGERPMSMIETTPQPGDLPARITTAASGGSRPGRMGRSRSWRGRRRICIRRWAIRTRPMTQALQALSTICRRCRLDARPIEAVGHRACRAGADGAEPVGEVIPDLATLGRLLQRSNGILKTWTSPWGKEVTYRAAGQTGARFHLELYLVTGDTPELPAGVYHYDAKANALAHAADWRLPERRNRGIGQRAVDCRRAGRPDRDQPDLAQCLAVSRS